MRAALLALAVAVGACAWGRHAPAATTGTIRGICRLSEPVERPTIDVAGMACDENHLSDRVVPGAGLVLADCLVSLEGVRAEGTWPPDMRAEDRRKVIEVRGGHFTPHVTWVRAGTQ